MAKTTKQAPGAASTAPAQASPEEAFDWSTYAGTTGFENMRPEDLGTPYLGIIQPKSPEIDITHQDFASKKIEGAKAGDIFNTLTRKVLGSFNGPRVAVVPCSYDKTYNEWRPESAGGGFIRAHRNEKILEEVTGRDDKNKDILRNGNLLVTTMTFFVLVLVEGEKPAPAIISMTSTQLKHGRLWNNMMAGLRIGPRRIVPPMFSHIYLLTSVIEKNDKGSWFGWNIEIGDMVSDRELISSASGIAQRVAIASKPQPALPATTDDNIPM